MQAFDPSQIVEILNGVLRRNGRDVALHEPHFGGREWDYLKDCLDSGWVSSAGAYVERFERELAALCEAPYAIAVVNGTAALQVALLLAGVGRDDEVLVPTLTFVATANAVAHCGAVPHFCDSATDTLGLDPEKLDSYLGEIAELRDGACRNKASGRRIAAVMAMHTFGHPVDLDALAEVAARWKLPLVEDAAEALGSRYKGRHVGRHGLLAALSFNGNKIVTTGGGGALLTHDPALAKAARHLTTTAKLPHRWAFDHDRVGFNYRLPNLNAALGVAQLEQLPALLAAKRRLAERYLQAFAQVPGVVPFREPRFAESNYWLNALLLDPALAGRRDDLLAATNDAGILARPAWTAMHALPMYRDCPRMDLSVAEDLVRRIVNLPSSPVLGGLDGA
ncbi:MAG: LegC family aminotransferase [Kiloniellales bacterium]